MHLPDHLYRDVGVFIDAGQLILLVVIAVFMWKYVQVVRQVQAIGRYWIDNLERQQGTARSPMPLNDPLPSTPVAREQGEGFHRGL
jgi:hypothetical protein